ncbi:MULTISPECIES: hypothetical protein [Nonomuraea]|uniref:Uncharacterized protein n=1 Tax=Nonomuraea ferruginea TaxID=46174 RepID=A0ABT4T1L0_9ACTN|nr:hypothetical protein [Nonomuraea ferruginea]MDA0643397.1 hypothetical protein [Nonomuraea ferruginea]
MTNAREPDWAYVGRSLLKVLAVTAALWLALVVADRALPLFVETGDERIAQVYGTAARVANPDERMHGYLDRGSLLTTTYTLWGEPRGAGPGEGGTDYEIVEDVFGTVRAPQLDGPSGSLADAIDSVEADPDGVSGKAAETSRDIIDGLPRTLDAVAVVDFADSVTAGQLVAFNRRHKICGGEDVSYIYSPSYFDDSGDPPSLNAVVWNRDMANHTWENTTYQCETEPEAALAAYREWVGILDESDDLDAFELTRGWLVTAAEEGVVHGLVVDRWKLADLRELLDDPVVEAVHLADVAFDFGAE